MNKLEKLQEVNPDLLQNFLKTRKSAAIPEDLQQYIIKVNAVPSVMHHVGASMTRVVRELLKQFTDLNFSTARDIYYDAMNFFHIDDSITVDAWDRIKITDWEVPVFIITNRIKHQDLGFEKKSLHDIVRKDEDGFYINLINSLETSDKEKKRLMREASIVDVVHEDIEVDE